jgi:hypothetical protein
MAKKKAARRTAKNTAAKRKTASRKKVAAKGAVKRKPVATQPKIPSKAELIVRQGFIIDATGGQQHALPEVLILGNREGLQYLADVFTHLAHQTKGRKRTSAADEGIHLQQLDHPVNGRLSDAIDFRFIPLTTANRAATFKQHGITMKSREHGSLFERYQGIAETQYTKVARRLERDRRHER